jgi:hypothetical protein
MMGGTNQERQWYSREELTPLLRAVVGIFDHCEVETVRRVVSGSDRVMVRTALQTKDLQRMIGLLDQLFPGTLDRYIDFRLEDYAVRKAAKRRGQR